MSTRDIPNPDTIRLAHQNYTDITSGSVDARWLVYPLAGQELDTEYLANQLVDAWFGDSRVSRILDIGAAAGWFLRENAFKFPDSECIGVEPYLNQYDAAIQAERKYEKGVLEILSTAIEVCPIPDDLETKQVRMIGSLAQSADWSEHLEPTSIDIISALFMLYHVPAPERIKVYERMKSLIRNYGLILISTSGADNKPLHRQIEEEIASRLNVTPPPHMNAGFTSEKADIELPENFSHVYKYHQKGFINFRDNNGDIIDYVSNTYRTSLVSMRNQFNGGEPLDKVLFEMELNRALNNALSVPGAKEMLSRCLYIVGDSDEFTRKIPILEKANFVRVS